MFYRLHLLNNKVLYCLGFGYWDEDQDQGQLDDKNVSLTYMSQL